jgi:3-phosphoshikimate 1-carboxyvinyltransferase
VTASEEADGFVVEPGLPSAAVVDSHGDHRLAMAFAVLGLRVPGIEIARAESVTKTFPGFFAALDQLR